MANMKRVRDAATGQMVPASEAEKRPKETVVEKVNTSLEKRVALLESVIEELGGPLAVLYRRRKKGLSD